MLTGSATTLCPGTAGLQPDPLPGGPAPTGRSPPSPDADRPAGTWLQTTVSISELLKHALIKSAVDANTRLCRDLPQRQVSDSLPRGPSASAGQHPPPARLPPLGHWPLPKCRVDKICPFSFFLSFFNEETASSNENGFSKLSPNQGRKLEINFLKLCCVILFNTQTRGVCASQSRPRV